MYKTLITNDRLEEIVRLLKQTPEEGLCIEVGVYQGGSLKYMSERFPDRKFIGFDTFEGLPKEDWNDKEVHQVGDFNDTSYKSVKEYLKENENVELVKGYFPDSAYNFELGIDPDDYEDSGYYYSFIHVDLDFYEGIRNAIRFFYPRLIKGGVMVFDDFNWPATPGVLTALKESGLKFFKTNANYQAYLIKE